LIPPVATTAHSRPTTARRRCAGVVDDGHFLLFDKAFAGNAWLVEMRPLAAHIGRAGWRGGAAA